MVDRILVGNIGGGVYGIKVSKAGIDVKTGDDAQMMFDSRAANTRVIMSGSIPTINAGGSLGTSRRKVDNVEIQLPALEYEPLVFLNFISKTNPAITGIPASALLGMAWMSGIYYVNPKDYTDFRWVAATNKLVVNALCVKNDYVDPNYAMYVQFLVFSNRSN